MAERWGKARLTLSPIKSPCTPDCPDRAVGCRGGCIRHQQYEAAKREEYEKKKAAYQSSYKLQAPRKSAGKGRK